MRRSLLACLAIATASPALAEPITYACQYTAGDQFSEFAAVNQIVIDGQAERFELRVAETIGTNNELTWEFYDRDTDEDSVVWVSEDDRLYVSGTRARLTYIFRRNDVGFDLVFADGVPFVYHEWECTS